VTITEAALPDDKFSLLGGSGTATFEKIPVGTSVKHQYFIAPKVSGTFIAPAAKVTYKADAETTTPQVRIPASQHWNRINRSYGWQTGLKGVIVQAE
jgi:Translocon-associated protein beta (TRAPB)